MTLNTLSEASISKRLPAIYSLYRPIDQALISLGRIKILDKSPATIVRNYLNRLLFRFVFLEQTFIATKLADGGVIYVKLNDQASASLLFEGKKNDDVASCLISLSTKAQCFLDIGANYGYFAVAIGRRRPEMPIIAVEPNPELGQLINKSINANALSAVKTVSAACGERHERMRLSIAERSSGTSSVCDGSDVSSNCVMIDVLPVDDLFVEIYNSSDSRPALVKIDVEGFEVQVLRGAATLLASQPVIVCELSPSSFKAVDNLIRPHGLFMYQLNGQDLETSRIRSIGRKNTDVLICTQRFAEDLRSGSIV